MPRYIDVEPFEGMLVVKPIVTEIDLGKYCMPSHYHQQDFVKKTAIDNIPTADVQEVKHGKWVYCRDNDYESGIHIAMCGNCNLTQSVVFWQRKPTFEFCPYCGARMDAKEEKRKNED